MSDTPDTPEAKEVEPPHFTLEVDDMVITTSAENED